MQKVEKELKESEKLKSFFSEFIYNVLGKNQSYNYLKYKISIEAGYVYLKASNQLINRNYVFVEDRKYIFKYFLLCKLCVNNVSNILDSFNQDQFNRFIIDNFIYEDISSNRFRNIDSYILKL